MLDGIRLIKKEPQSTIIIVLYLVGLIGLTSPYHELFSKLAIFQILICSAFVLFQYLSRVIFCIRFITLMIFGLIVEIIGVNTGFPFGDYHYGDNLGFYIFGVPLVIALNWAVVIFCSKSLLKNFIKVEPGLSILTALFATSLDYFIEQTAADFGFWFWVDGVIPLSNYVAWFIVAFIASFILGNKADETSREAIVNIIGMYIFFFLLSFVINLKT